MDIAAAERHLIEDPIPKLLRQLAIPAAVGFFFNTMYNVVDTWIAGQVSAEALAALSLSFPVYFIIIALSSGIGTGVTALMANSLGAGDEHSAKHCATQAISYGVIASVVLSIVGYISSPYLFGILGASGAYLETALLYMQTVFIGSIFISMTFILNGVLNAVGNTRAFRDVLIIGFFLNLILSPVLAFGWFGFPELGILGIAIATVITNMVGTLYLARHIYQSELLEVTHFLKNLWPQAGPFRDITAQGLPAGFSMMTIALGSFVLTYFVSTFGQSAVAGYGAALRIEQIVLIPGIGINIAVLTLIGQNNGAKKFDRVREIIKTGLLYSLIISTVASLIMLLGSALAVSIFTNDAAVAAIAREYLGVAMLMTWAYGIVFVTDSVLRGLKRPTFPLVLGIFRQALLPVPVLYAVVLLYSMEISAIWWSMFVIVWSATIASLVYMYYRVGKHCTR